jgi:two-component system KDP operon response regulator KdpE
LIAKVLVIEDDREIVESIFLSFQIYWPEATIVSTRKGVMGARLVQSDPPDVIILDLGLPDISGFEVLEQIRLFSSVPILILTVRAQEEDIIKALEGQANDYMLKPFRQKELLARVRALLPNQMTHQTQAFHHITTNGAIS